MVVAQEMIHSLNKMKVKTGYFAIKVDLSKAYDRLDWKFIQNTLIEVGLPSHLIDIIMHRVTSVQSNAKWHSSRTEYFRTQKGIWQGDPLSPYLFVICMDKLSHLISEAVDDGVWLAPRSRHNGPIGSHLMSVDDLLLFSQTIEDHLARVMGILNGFCPLLGQQVSHPKTHIYFSNNVSNDL